MIPAAIAEGTRIPLAIDSTNEDKLYATFENDRSIDRR